jgi:hypothetical protein
MKIGFFGTLRGLTQLQKDAFTDLIKEMDIKEFHHGDCVGADEQAHNIIRKIAPDCEINIHPPVRDLHRAYCEGDVDFVEMDYIARNEEIIDFTDMVVACTDQRIKGQRKVGPNDPWRALEYAEEVKKHTIIIKGNGEKEERFSGKNKPRYK